MAPRTTTMAAEAPSTLHPESSDKAFSISRERGIVSLLG